VTLSRPSSAHQHPHSPLSARRPAAGDLLSNLAAATATCWRPPTTRWRAPAAAGHPDREWLSSSSSPCLHARARAPLPRKHARASSLPPDFKYPHLPLDLALTSRCFKGMLSELALIREYHTITPSEAQASVHTTHTRTHTHTHACVLHECTRVCS